jgi:hypothetical protein
MVVNHRTEVQMDSKRRAHDPSVKPLRMPLLDRINHVVIEE